MNSEIDQAAASDMEEEEEEEEEKKKHARPPSSYGSMKSESIEDEEEEEEEEKAGGGGEGVFLAPPAPPDPPAPPVVGSQMMYSMYTETHYTEATEMTRPPDGMVIETGGADLEDMMDDELDDEDEILTTCSPEPPEPLEMEGLIQDDENGQPGKLHPDLSLPHVFRSIQNVLTRLSSDELLNFKTSFTKWETVKLPLFLDGDLLDFVDKIFEVYGQSKALSKTISTLESINKVEEVEELKTVCDKAIFCFYLKEKLSRKFFVIREGVIQAGKQNLLNSIYVEPQISTRAYGGVDLSHEILGHSPAPFDVPSEETFVPLSNLFRLQKEDGSLARTVVTTGLPGVGMSVSVAKFALDWAEERANRDLHYVIKLSFRALRLVLERSGNEDRSMLDIMQYFHFPVKDLKLLEEDGVKFLVIMDCFDCYDGTLDWKNAPVINDNYTKVSMDVLVVNIIRGNVLRGARLWILGRRAAVSQIPSQFVDIVTELRGFTDEMKDDYLTRRLTDARMAENIVRHYKRAPTIRILARHPFFCWVVGKVFSYSFRLVNYGSNRPRITPFLITYVTIMTNRRLKFYYRRRDNEMKWTVAEYQLLARVGKMALKMLEVNTSVFTEKDLKEFDLDLKEVVVRSGLCTELNPEGLSGRRRFCFAHFTIQEFMAALYTFFMFYKESRNVLNAGGSSKLRYRSVSPAGLVECALALTMRSEVGHYDLFLRYLCGLFSPHCYKSFLRTLFPQQAPKMEGEGEVVQLLEQTLQTASGINTRNLDECLRELTQESD
ncbi:protein NLRC3-like [Fundulus diaphanus]